MSSLTIGRKCNLKSSKQEKNKSKSPTEYNVVCPVDFYINSFFQRLFHTCLHPLALLLNGDDYIFSGPCVQPIISIKLSGYKCLNNFCYKSVVIVAGVNQSKMLRTKELIAITGL